MNTNNYRPRFKPEVYLRFFNNADYHFSIKQANNFPYMIFLYTANFDEDSNLEYSFSGSCLEECLDQAIIATKFEENL